MMKHFTPDEYDRLERAVARGGRLAVYRRGTEYLIVPQRITVRGGREAIEAVHPTTGDAIVLLLDEIESIEVVS
jgi:hypothetical protein